MRFMFHTDNTVFKSPAIRSDRSLRMLNAFYPMTLCEGAVVLSCLAGARSAPASAVLLGYSWARLSLIAAVCAVFLLLYLFLHKASQRERLNDLIRCGLDRSWLAGLGLTAAVLSLMAAIWILYRSIDDYLFTASASLVSIPAWWLLVSIQGMILLGSYAPNNILGYRILPHGLWVSSRWQFAALIIPGATILAFLVYFLFYGQPNADEGWYLYASHLVYRGQTLYQDFAYTQMPLLPYIYGLPQVIVPSFLVGRITSIIFFLATVAMSCKISHVVVGKPGIFWVLMLYATYTTGLYSGVAVKTYALTAFFMVGTLFWLLLPLKDELRLPLAALFSICTALVRLSALAFALPVLVYVIFLAQGKSRWSIAAITVLCGLFALRFFLPDPEVAIWNLVKYHVVINDSTGWELVRERLSHIGSSLLFFRYYFIPLFVALCLALLAFGRGKKLNQTGRHLVIVSLGIGAYAAANLAGGRFQTEYFVAGLLVLFPILVIMLLKLAHEYTPGSPVWLCAALSLLAASTISFNAEGLNYALFYNKMCDGCVPVRDIHSVARVVEQSCLPEERVLALEYLFTVVDAGRATLPGMSMAQFSLTDLPASDAERYRLVTWPMVKDMVAGQQPRIMLLSAEERQVLLDDPATQHAILESYDLILQQDHYGQRAQQVFLYQRK